MKPGDVVSYTEMCTEERTNLQRGMNFRLRDGVSVILMSLRQGAPYADRIEADGKVLVYEGHDIPRRQNGSEPKSVDQPRVHSGGSLTQNGMFYEAAIQRKTNAGPAELVRVYEKIRAGVWVYNGIFELTDAWRETSNAREVFKFKLEMTDEVYVPGDVAGDIEHTRLIPTAVKLEVWKRDRGQCVQCGSKDNLHFDHIIPYSKGGSSLVAENIQLLCARHNLKKRDRII